MRKRKIDTLVLSDIHLGTYGCHAKELVNYLKSVDPETIILNGDIIDIWQFKKRYWPKSHMKVIKHFFQWLSKGKTIYYVTGNHDEMLRKFEGFQIGKLQIVNKLSIDFGASKAWIFHGDVFDVTMKNSKWLAKLGGKGYDILIVINRLTNQLLNFFGKERISLSKKIKNSVKGAVSFISNFEQTVVDIAMDNQFNYVICGHIHQPIIKNYNKGNKSVVYLNSGDWIENLTALEYNDNEWSLYKYEDSLLTKDEDTNDNVDVKSTKEIFDEFMNEFKLNSI